MNAQITNKEQNDRQELILNEISPLKFLTSYNFLIYIANQPIALLMLYAFSNCQ